MSSNYSEEWGIVESVFYELHVMLNADGKLDLPKGCPIERRLLISFVTSGLIAGRYLDEGETFPPGATELTMDSKGGIKVPAHLLKRAGITREAVFLLTQDFFVIWSEPGWALEMENAGCELDSKAIGVGPADQRVFLKSLRQIWPS